MFAETLFELKDTLIIENFFLRESPTRVLFLRVRSIFRPYFQKITESLFRKGTFSKRNEHIV